MLMERVCLEKNLRDQALETGQRRTDIWLHHKSWYLNFVVGISFNKGVVLCERYMGAMTSEKYADITKYNFPQALKNSINLRAKRIVQDNSPRQQSEIARLALAQINGKQMKIPARNLDIKCIENGLRKWFVIG